MLIYSRAIPEGEQEPLQWPENVVVRPPPFHFSCHQCQLRELHPLNSGTFSATTKFSLDKSRRVLVRRVKPLKSLFRRLRPYRASPRRWKYPLPLGSPWTCPIETRGKLRICRWEYRCASGPATVSCHLVGEPHPQRPHCYFFVILLYIRYYSDDVLYRLPLGKMTSVDVWASTLSFLATMSVTLVLGCERPRLRGRTKEHLGYFHPIAAIATCEKRFFSQRASKRTLNVDEASQCTHRARHAHGREESGR